MTYKNIFKKQERLTGKKNFDRLLGDGRLVKHFPFVVYWNYSGEQEYPVKMAVSVSKRRFKRAVDRNLLKRRIRESYRLKKHDLNKTLAESDKSIQFLIVYISGEILDYNTINLKLTDLLDIIKEEVIKD